MKRGLNKILLEAIHRGIKFALDDFEDNELIGQLTETIKEKNITKDYLNSLNYTVDLGLPSGTLWCKYNLGCDWEKLNNNPQDIKPEDLYGDFYAWGELETKSDYSWTTYTRHTNKTYSDFNKKVFTKYIPSYLQDNYWNNKGYADNKINLDSADDIVTQTFGKKWKIPSRQLFQELIENTTFKTVKNYKINGEKIIDLNGLVLTSKINKKKLFVPAAGYHDDSEFPNDLTYNGYIWSTTLSIDDPTEAYALCFNRLGPHLNEHFIRSYGFSIRPVINL